MQKILVANRGEIAMRILRTVKKMGIKSVAIYSEADREAPHVRFADEAVYLGPAPSAQSYLRGDKIIEICKMLNVDGIHPGYGFLSENADFARQVEEAGITFIGPAAESMRIMGSKLAAKEAVKKYNIPMVPGIDEAVDDVKIAKTVAAEIGYPVLIKASAGGGGKGMRIVEKEDDLEEQMERAISEARSAFGDGSVFIEKYISSPRHIEIQIVGDKQGNYVHGYERECSIQRRHQKVIEETPSAIVDDELRHRMGEAAILVGKSCNYYSTGTVEFLVDENRDFYFLEMNTRLQVEHPVSELITGLDLVELQIMVARGENLPIDQNFIQMNGHAIELRIYAEDPLNNFMPSIGKLTAYRIPEGDGIRVDDGYEEGMDIPIYYDPLIAKLIVHAKDRDQAIQKMLLAIRQFKIEGVSTTLPFGKFVFRHPAFISGDFNTHFVKQYYIPEKIQEERRHQAEAAALIALHIYMQQTKKLSIVEHKSTSWKRRLSS